MCLNACVFTCINKKKLNSSPDTNIWNKHWGLQLTECYFSPSIYLISWSKRQQVQRENSDISFPSSAPQFLLRDPGWYGDRSLIPSYYHSRTVKNLNSSTRDGDSSQTIFSWEPMLCCKPPQSTQKVMARKHQQNYILCIKLKQDSEVPKQYTTFFKTTCQNLIHDHHNQKSTTYQ